MSWLESLVRRRIDAALVRALQDSPRAAELLAQLAGRSLIVQATGTPYRIRLRALRSGLALERCTPEDRAADAILSGSPPALLQLTGKDPQAPLRSGAVRLEGDAELAEQFRALLERLRPSLEGSLAPLLGRTGAHLLASGLAQGREATHRLGESLLHSGADFLAHERRDLVPHTESRSFVADVERLREQVDRLDARTRLIEARGTSGRRMGS